MKDKILLIDGLNFIWRANIKFGAQDKQQFVLIYNFFRNLRALIEELSPNKVFFCLEGKNNFRYGILPEYKANRLVKYSSKSEDSKSEDSTSADDNFSAQKKIILELLQYLPITSVHADRFEADDVIATLAENLKDENVTIVSNDSDLIQLLQKDYVNLSIFNPFNKKYIQAPEYHYLAWKCLRGDKKTDNIPGLVSDKKATELVSNASSLNDFLLLDENKANFNLNKELIELRIIDDDEMNFSTYYSDLSKLKEEFIKMEFNSMVTEKYWDRFISTFKNLR